MLFQTPKRPKMTVSGQETIHHTQPMKNIERRCMIVEIVTMVPSSPENGQRKGDGAVPKIMARSRCSQKWCNYTACSNCSKNRKACF
jgi:hypothetical protein